MLICFLRSPVVPLPCGVPLGGGGGNRPFWMQALVSRLPSYLLVGLLLLPQMSSHMGSGEPAVSLWP